MSDVVVNRQHEQVTQVRLTKALSAGRWVRSAWIPSGLSKLGSKVSLYRGNDEYESDWFVDERFNTTSFGIRNITKVK